VAFVRQMLFRCKTNGEIPSEVTILWVWATVKISGRCIEWPECLLPLS
jgi:hypothetical protein